jgi:16S rRNA (cytosine967-C5)-methyltransferase
MPDPDRASLAQRLQTGHEAALMTDPTRDAAFDLLTGVFDRHRPLEQALDGLAGLDARDRAAGHRLAAAVLRRTGSLDAALEPFLKKAPPDPVRHILRIGAAGLLLLDTPAHAAVATAVALARSRRLVAFCPLVNAVLRRVAEAGTAALDGLDGPRLDTLPWLWRAWGADARAIAEAHLIEAPLDLSLMPGAAAPPGGLALPGGSLRYPAGTRVLGLEGFDGGGFWVQDAAAALPARLLDARPGERVADLCAAPGGKTAQLAATGAAVIAVERDASRTARLRENLDRLKLTVETVVADAAEWHPPGPLDAVLLDAPCSATGTIRRHPDVPHLKRASDIGALAAGQDRLLEAACAILRPGGRLVYAVCSLQPEEGPERMAAALARLRLRAAPFTPADVPGLPGALTPEGWIRTIPSMWPEHGGLDGFFIARATRV